MSGFVKLFSAIVTSSVWVEDDATLRVWIALLALADSEGVIEGSVPGLANLCRLSVDATESILDKLEGPDKYSRSPEHEGRRVEIVPGGWRVLNYKKYRERGQGTHGSRAPYMRAYREKLRQGGAVTRNSTNVTCDIEDRRQKTEKRNEQRSVRDGALRDRVDTPAARAVVAARVEILGPVMKCRPDVTLPKLECAQRALDAGFTLESIRMAFQVIARAGKEERSIAAFCRWKNRSNEYALRPEILQKLVDYAGESEPGRVVDEPARVELGALTFEDRARRERPDAGVTA